MEENIKVDKEYLASFNLGYELAKELNLKSPMFKEVNSSSPRIEAMQMGMAECTNEIKQGLDEKTSKGQGFDLSI